VRAPPTRRRCNVSACWPATVVQSCKHQLALNALPAVLPVDADSRFVRSRSTSSGSGAAGVAVPGAERRHPRWTDSAGVGSCRVVAQERQGDVPVEAGEQLQHRRVVDLHDRPSWFSTSRWFPISLPDHGSAPAVRPATARVGPAAASAGARAGGSRLAGTRRKRQTRPTRPAAAWQPRHASLTAVQQESAEPEAAASAGEPAGGVQYPVAQVLGSTRASGVSCRSRVWAQASRSTAIMAAVSQAALTPKPRLGSRPSLVSRPQRMRPLSGSYVCRGSEIRGLGWAFAREPLVRGVYVMLRVIGMGALMRSKARRWVGVGSARAGMVTWP
jgi:hypothetical protein